MLKCIMVFLLPLTFLSAQERLIEVKISSRQDLEVFYNLDIPIQDVKEGVVSAFATDAKIEELERRGFLVKVLIADYQKELEKILLYYHTYTEICSLMTLLARTYPNIAKLETLGFSHNGNIILGMKVSDNPETDEAEIGIRLTGAIHGNEKISTEVTFSFLRYLLENYPLNPQVRYLVDNRQIFIVPILNPDGHIANRRHNGRGVDLNRDYGYMWAGWGGSLSPFSQPETKAMRRHSEKNPVSLQYDYHSVASYVNYLWDFHPADPPDSNLIIYISRRYADSTYGSPTTRLTPINGYDWYEVRGSCQDMIFGTTGALATTIETQQPGSRARIDSICSVNRRALLDMLTIVEWGIKGRVLDTFSLSPLSALIKFKSPVRWHTYASLPTGFYHKFLEGGIRCTLEVYSPGYEVKRLAVELPHRSPLDLEIYLRPSSVAEGYGYRVEWVRRATNDEPQRTITPSGLGVPDSLFFSLSFGGEIVLGLPRGFPIRNLPGSDFRVIEGNDGSQERYNVYCAVDLFSTWHLCGQGQGSSEFDLQAAGLDTAYYVKIVDTNSGSQSLPYAGFDLDGLVYRFPETPVAEEKSLLNISMRLPTILKGDLKSFPTASVRIFNIQGRLLSSPPPQLPTGIYFVLDEQGIRKVIKIR